MGYKRDNIPELGPDRAGRKLARTAASKGRGRLGASGRGLGPRRTGKLVLFDFSEPRAKARVALAAAGAAAVGLSMGAVAVSVILNISQRNAVPPQVVRVALPPAPAPAASVPVAAAVKQAAKQAKQAKRAERSRDLECLTEAVYFEARGESRDGQLAVAQVVLNRVKHPAFPKSVCGVVYQGAKNRKGCQFSFACDGRAEHASESAAWRRAQKIAARALAGVVVGEIGSATHFHALRVQPSWGPGLRQTAQVGLHVFYKLTPRGSAKREAAPEKVEFTRLASAEAEGAELTQVKDDAVAHADAASTSAVETGPPPAEAAAE